LQKYSMITEFTTSFGLDWTKIIYNDSFLK
jgi:hypothetical protein